MRFPTVPYPGGKGRLASILVGFMPKKGRLYREPFAGRGNVAWAAMSSKLEFEQWELNDMFTAPFFEAIREIGDTMEVYGTVQGRILPAMGPLPPRRHDCHPPGAAAHFRRRGLRRRRAGRKKGACAAGYTKTMRACHALLQSTHAKITCLDWKNMDWDSLTEEDFVFFDPPYKDADVRSYRSDIDYGAMASLLLTAKFRWMLTEYSDFYVPYLGQPFYTKSMQLISADHRLANGGKERRIEKIWKNY